MRPNIRQLKAKDLEGTQEKTQILGENKVKRYDIDKLIERSTPPDKWLAHLENDLMKFWDQEVAYTFENDLFPTYRTNKGERLPEDPDKWPDEIKEALEDSVTRGLVTPEYNFVRAHSRQTYAYGIAYHMTGREKYFNLCQKGVEGLLAAIDGNDGMFTKQTVKHGKWEEAKQDRISQDLAYGLTGLGMYYYLTHDETILHKIIQVKNYIFDQYLDKGKGLFTWLPKDQQDKDIEIVAQLDQIYAYMLFLTPSLPEPYQSEWKKDLKQIVDIIIYRFYSERYQFFWGQDMTSSGLQLGTDHTDFGHSVKTMWLIYKIGVLVGEMSYVMFARANINQILEEAYIGEEDNGFGEGAEGSWARRYDENGEIDIDKEWWILAELDQACALLALNDPSYLGYLNNTYKYWFTYMVDKEYGEIWHMVNGETKQPMIQYPKVHSWKTSLHSFEHSLFAYMTSSQIKGIPFEVFYAFRDEEEAYTYDVQPYMFEANIVNVKCCSKLEQSFNNSYKIRVTYDTLR